MLRNSIQLYKEAYANHPREIWTLVVLTLINRMGTMVVPFLAVYLTTIQNFSLEQAGYLMGAFGLGSLGGSFFGGKLSDHFGARRIMIAALLSSGLLLISLQWAESFGGFMTLIFTTGLFGDAFRPAFMSYLGSFVSKSQTARTMALTRLAINLGMALAPLSGGFLAVKWGYHWLFWIDGLSCMIAAMYFWYASRNWRDSNANEEDEAQKTKTTFSPAAYRNKSYLLFLLATFLMGFCFIQWFHTVPVFLKTEWGFDERYIGILMGTNCIIISLIEMPIVHYLEKAGQSLQAILGGLFFFGLSFLPFLLPSSLALCFVAVLCFTFGEILFLPFNNALPLHMSPVNRRGEYMAWYWMTWSMTQVLGPVIGLNFSSRWGFSGFWFIVFGLLFISFLMNLFWRENIADTP